MAYDIETTGLDKEKDRIIEVGLALYSTGQHRILESAGFLVKSDGVPITPEITEITGITQAAVDRFGYEQDEALTDIISWFGRGADAVVAHNGIRFDMPVTFNSLKRLGIHCPMPLVIDTMTDIPGVKGEQLVTMCAKVGFVNRQHSAEDDAKSVLTLMSLHNEKSSKTSFDAMLERAKSPTVIVQSHQDRSDNKAAKKLKFRWNPDYKVWWKAVKEMDINELMTKATFEISIEKTWDVESLDTGDN